jgi:hypothetical protein
MTMYFFYPIQQCAQHIYHTALPLSPLSSTPYRINQQEIARDRTHVTGFLNPPSNWGSLLTTISVAPRRPTAIATFAEKIAVACEDVVNIYDAVTFGLEQSLHTPQPATRIHGSEDGSILYSTHTLSVALWDIQTGGLIDTFHTPSGINDSAVSQTDGHIACCLSDGSLVFRNGNTKIERSFRDLPPVVSISWLSSTEIAVATEQDAYILDINTGSTSEVGCDLNPTWGIAVLSSDEVVVGSSVLGATGEQDFYFFSSMKRIQQSTWSRQLRYYTNWRFRGRLTSPMHVGHKIVCVTPPNGVKAFNITDRGWTRPPPLERAKSLAASLNRNLVVQTEDSVQIFSFQVITSDAPVKDEQPSHMYPLGEKHAVCLQINRHLTVIKLKTLETLRPGLDTLLLESLLTRFSASARASYSRGLAAEFGVSTVVEAWRSDAPLPRWTEGAEEDALLGGSSPTRAWIATLYGLPRRELRLKSASDGTILAKLPLEDDGPVGTGVVYDLTFDSETRFHLKVDGPGCHVKIPYHITAPPSLQDPYTITQGEPVPLSQSRKASPYTLDANCE